MDKLDEGFVAREMARFDQRFALCDLAKSDDLIAGRRRYRDSSLDKMFTAWLAATTPLPDASPDSGETEKALARDVLAEHGFTSTAVYDRVLAAMLHLSMRLRSTLPTAVPPWAAADSPSFAYGMGAAENDVDVVAYALFDAFAKAEPEHIITRYPASYWATFAQMARAVLKFRPSPSPAIVKEAGEACDWDFGLCRRCGRQMDDNNRQAPCSSPRAALSASNAAQVSK